MSKHTPGPWLSDGHYLNRVAELMTTNVYGQKQVTVESDEANARLIAAAPHMFELLSEFNDLLPDIESMDPALARLEFRLAKLISVIEGKS